MVTSVELKPAGRRAVASGAADRGDLAAVALIRTGDLAAVRPARRAGRIIGPATADPVSLFNPRVVVIGGQLARIEEQLLPVSGKWGAAVHRPRRPVTGSSWRPPWERDQA